MITHRDVDIDEALKTRQFYQLWVVLCLNVTAGIGVLGVARTMMVEIFGGSLPDIVDGAFAAVYVVMISVFNMIGRFFWASTSDFIGRRNTYWIFFGLGIVLYCSIPFCAQRVSADPNVVWLVYFYAASMLIFTMYGGGLLRFLPISQTYSVRNTWEAYTAGCLRHGALRAYSGHWPLLRFGSLRSTAQFPAW
jgi:Na+/melibiose symporter-like transporter